MVEHWSRKPGVMGSIPIGGIFCFNRIFIQVIKRLSQLAGFEPTRAEPIGFQVQRLNHSATTACVMHLGKKVWRCGGSNPGPFTCKANALPLSYIPCVSDEDFICSNIEEDRVGINNQQKVHVPTGGLEPPIFGLGDRRLIH